MNKTLQRARLTRGKPADALAVVALLSNRIDWMEERGINQWPREHYLAHYNASYFEERARRGELWLLKDGSRLAACAVLLEWDERWGNDPIPAYYVHNLAADPDMPGAGGRLLTHFEDLARQAGKKALRLDCKTGAKAINAYYRKKGFRFVGYWKQPEYGGNRREKILL